MYSAFKIKHKNITNSHCNSIYSYINLFILICELMTLMTVDRECCIL